MFGNAGMARFVDETFGCFGASATHPDCLYKRVTHAGDPVPLMPPAEWGWRQHGGEIYISKADLPPSQGDLIACSGSQDASCLAGGDTASESTAEMRAAQQAILAEETDVGTVANKRDLVPPRWRVWQLLFAHREYIWRLGLCFDPDWPWDSRPSPPVRGGDEL